MSYIKTTFTDETELIKSMLYLYNGGNTVDLDPCFSKGVFWKKLEEPKLKFDLVPQREDVVEGDCRNLPLESESLNSIMFDPPFLVAIGKSTNGIMRKRFSGFRTKEDLQSMYSTSMREFHRLLKSGGHLFFKCQDLVTSGKQLFTHVFIINEANSYKKFYEVEDLFVYIRERKIVDPRWSKKQLHAYKTHSYYLVLRKK